MKASFASVSILFVLHINGIYAPVSKIVAVPKLVYNAPQKNPPVQPANKTMLPSSEQLRQQKVPLQSDTLSRLKNGKLLTAAPAVHPNMNPNVQQKGPGDQGNDEANDGGCFNCL